MGNTINVDTLPDNIFTDFALVYGIGKKKILFNRLSLDFGAEMAIVPGGIKHLADIISPPDYYVETFEDRVRKRLGGYIFINFKLGLGLLL